MHSSSHPNSITPVTAQRQGLGRNFASMAPEIVAPAVQTHEESNSVKNGKANLRRRRTTSQSLTQGGPGLLPLPVAQLSRHCRQLRYEAANHGLALNGEHVAPERANRHPVEHSSTAPLLCTYPPHSSCRRFCSSGWQRSSQLKCVPSTACPQHGSAVLFKPPLRSQTSRRTRTAVGRNQRGRCF